MASDPLVGTELGVYGVEEKLGAGGMGALYRARNLALDRPVALKLLPQHLLDDATARARFQREIQTAIAVEHPNVVPVYDAGYERGYFYIAMRLVVGTDLSEVIAGRPLPLARGMRLFHDMARALAHVHRLGLVHRDVKPQNVLIWHPGESDEYALLADFGIARALDSSTGLTRGIIGTAEYIAPEILAWKPATAASDQYSLACVAFEMLTGTSPYRGRQLPAAHLEEPVPSLAGRASGVPRHICEAIERALRKDPVHRMPSVDAFAAAMSVERASAAPGVPNQSGKEREVSVRVDRGLSPRARRVGAGEPDPARWSWRDLWMAWAILPLFNGLTWLHAGILTRSARDFVYMGLYSLVLVALVVESAITGSEEASDALTAAAIIAWLVGMVHVFIERKRVARHAVARRQQTER